MKDLYSVQYWFVQRWKICTTLNDLYYVEWYVLRWMICITLSDLYYVERFELRWMICSVLNYLHRVELFAVQRWMIWATLNDLYYVEWFVQHWMIFYLVAKFLPPWMTCAAKELYSVERFVLRSMSRSAMDNLYNVELFGLPLIVNYRLFNECQVCLFKKILSDILH